MEASCLSLVVVNKLDIIGSTQLLDFIAFKGLVTYSPNSDKHNIVYPLKLFLGILCLWSPTPFLFANVTIYQPLYSWSFLLK